MPVYDEKANTFTLPEGSVPLPLFPMEGMFTRVVNTRAPGSGDGEPSAFIETSTPSLIGQMGGPVFGGEAVVWGIQSHTMHHALGFRPPVPDGAAGQVEHQFLNTGLAVHAAVNRVEKPGIANQPVDTFEQQIGLEIERPPVVRIVALEGLDPVTQIARLGRTERR